MKIYCDGSGWSGIRSLYAIVFEKTGKKIIKEFSEKFTSNEMEYKAVEAALELCKKKDEIITDSSLVVNQVKGEWRIKDPKFLPYVDRIRKLLEKKKAKLTFMHRGHNLAGHVIENRQKYGVDINGN